MIKIFYLYFIFINANLANIFYLEPSSFIIAYEINEQNRNKK
jgi:hypothetical protein